MTVLQRNPLTVILSIAFAAGMVYLLNRFLYTRYSGDKGYQKALKSQKKKGKLTPSEMNKLTRLKKPSRNIPFKVIEGNKKKKTPKDKEKQTYYH